MPRPMPWEGARLAKHNWIYYYVSYNQIVPPYDPGFIDSARNGESDPHSKFESVKVSEQ